MAQGCVVFVYPEKLIAGSSFGGGTAIGTVATIVAKNPDGKNCYLLGEPDGSF